MTAIGTVATPLMWAGFMIFVLAMLALDLFVFGGRRAHKVSVREAATWSLAWLTLALSFSALVWWYANRAIGPNIASTKVEEFITGYILELSLSVENMFVFLMIFNAFHIPLVYQRRVLLYGVLGAILLRTPMILGGAWIIQEFHWVLYLFGAFLVITGVRMLMAASRTPDLVNNPALRMARRYLRISEGTSSEHFTVVKEGIRYFTPLFLVLVLIEVSDVVFAVDSIAAIFAVTTDPFIVFTSNIFAIMGLRSLYFLLADVAGRFHLLKYGLATVLTFIGAKMLFGPWYHMPTQISLAVVALVLASSVLASLIATRRGEPVR